MPGILGVAPARSNYDQAMSESSADGQTAADAVLDRDTLDALASQLEDKIGGLVNRFEERLAGSAPAIHAALAREDLGEVARVAHSLKSVSATFGGAAVASTSAALEVAAREGRSGEAGPLAEQLTAESAATQRALEQWAEHHLGAGSGSGGTA